MLLDKFDLHILDELQRDGRLSNQALAERVGLSPSPCLRRVKALEAGGWIAGYQALLDPGKLGLQLMALVQIGMDRHTPERFERFERAIAQWPEVLECLLITGQSADYQLKVIVPDLHAYQDILLNKINKIEGVAQVHSSFVLRRVIHRHSLPLPASRLV